MEQRYEFYIRATPDQLWAAIVDPAARARYQFGIRLSSDWTPGAPIELRAPDGSAVLGTGQVVESDPPHRLVHTMTALWGDDVKSEGASRVTWEIEAVGDSCHLTLTHDHRLSHVRLGHRAGPACPGQSCVADTGVTVADVYAEVLGDEHTAMPDGAVTSADWVWPGG